MFRIHHQSNKLYLITVLLFVFAISITVNSQDNLDYLNDLQQHVLTLEDLGVGNTLVINEQDGVNILFGLPADWDMINGMTIHLDTSTLVTVASEENQFALPSKGLLLVEFNNNPIAPIIIFWDQEEVIDIFIPSELIISTRNDKRHELSLFIESGLECKLSTNFNLAIKPSSSFQIPYISKPIALDLRAYPYPIYQRSFVDDSVLFILPDDPTHFDLEAAMNISAGLGDVSSGQVLVELISESQVTAELVTAHHLIYIGQHDDFETFPLISSMANLQLPDENSSSSYGSVEMATSPFNRSKVMFWVTGIEPESVSLAGQALSTANLRISTPNNKSIIQSGTLSTPTYGNLLNSTLAQMGIGNILLDNDGFNRVVLDFEVDNISTVGAGAYIDIVISHSTLLNYIDSGFVAFINDTPIGTIELSHETAENYIRRINISKSILRDGHNTLTFEAELNTLDRCNLQDSEVTWLNILSDTTLFVPNAIDPVIQNEIELFNLDDYPDPFIFPSTLEETALIVPRDNPNIWNAAIKVAFNLGDMANGNIAKLKLRFADEIGADVQSSHLMVFGKPSELEILDEWREFLPAPFKDNNNFVNEDNLSFGYVMPNDRDLGYIQLFQSPYIQKHGILLVSGSTDIGVQWAANALITGSLRNSLFGDFAIIDDLQVIAQRLKPIPMRNVSETVTIENTSPPNGLQALLDDDIQGNQPEWILPAMRITLIAMGGIILFVFITFIFRMLYTRLKGFINRAQV